MKQQKKQQISFSYKKVISDNQLWREIPKTLQVNISGGAFPCDGPGRGGTCEVSPWDTF